MRLSIAVKYIAAYSALTGTLSTFAQQTAVQPLQNVVQLSASGAVEVQQDLLSINMNTTREGADASSVQTQLKTALDTALAEAKKAVQPGQLDVRTGNFSLFPRYGKDSKVINWQGSVDMCSKGATLPASPPPRAKFRR